MRIPLILLALLLCTPAQARRIPHGQMWEVGECVLDGAPGKLEKIAAAKKPIDAHFAEHGYPKDFKDHLEFDAFGFETGVFHLMSTDTWKVKDNGIGICSGGGSWANPCMGIPKPWKRKSGAVKKGERDPLSDMKAATVRRKMMRPFATKDYEILVPDDMDGPHANNETETGILASTAAKLEINIRWEEDTPPTMWTQVYPLWPWDVDERMTLARKVGEAHLIGWDLISKDDLYIDGAKCLTAVMEVNEGKKHYRAMMQIECGVHDSKNFVSLQAVFPRHEEPGKPNAATRRQLASLNTMLCSFKLK